MSETGNIQCPLDITVAIPTYNGAKRIPLLLERLKDQIKTDGLEWEVIVVDNNSQDNTAAVIRDCQTQWQSQWLPEVPLHYYFEPRQGAAFARQKAVQEAKGALLGFLDDDNLPDKTWVFEACAFSKKHPRAGAYGGQIHGEYEIEPPNGFEKISPFLAVREHGDEPFRFQPEKLILPPAASLVVRRQAWLDAIPQDPNLSGATRKDKDIKSFISGEDYEILLYLHKAGWEIWYAPNMSTWHQIPAKRFDRQYLLNLARGSGLTTYQLLLINAPIWQRPILFLKTILGGLKRIVLHRVKHGRTLGDDIASAFLMEFYIGGLLSPFVRRTRGR